MKPKSKEEFIKYLKNTLIPDLRKSGQEFTAYDFETCIDLIENGIMLYKFEELSEDAQQKAIEDNFYIFVRRLPGILQKFCCVLLIGRCQ